MSSDSESSGSGYSSSDSDSDSPTLIQKPIFISTKKKSEQLTTTANARHDIAIQKLDHQLQIQATEVDVDYDGTIDTDNLDVEAEFKDWQARERDRKRLAAEAKDMQEQEKNDRIRRSHFSQSETLSVQSDEPKKLSKLGVFHSNAEGMEKFLKREYSSVDDMGDHSRPTRFKSK